MRVQDGRTEWGPMGSFPGAAGSTPARLVDTPTQDAPESALLGGERFEGADPDAPGNVSQGDNAMYQLAVQGRKEAQEQEPRIRRDFAYGHIAPGEHAIYVLGILEDAITRSSRPSEVTGHVLEVAERATVEGEHARAAALRGVTERIAAAAQMAVSLEVVS